MTDGNVVGGTSVVEGNTSTGAVFGTVTVGVGVVADASPVVAVTYEFDGDGGKAVVGAAVSAE